MKITRKSEAYDAILFDLDGTLTDPKVGITKGIQYALSKFNIAEANLCKLEKFIGPPLFFALQEFYSFDEVAARQAVEFYREYLWNKGIYENHLYPGISELLVELKGASKNLIVATSKLTSMAEEVLKHFTLYGYFSLIIGCNPDSTRSAKTEIIQYILTELPELKTQKVVMIGDKEHDIIAAKNNGIDSIAVTYGYGSLEELRNAKPTHIANSVDELSELLIS